MIYAQVWKPFSVGGGFFANHYYVDGDLALPESANYFLSQLAIFDRFFTGTKTGQVCVTASYATQERKFPFGSSWSWTPFREAWNGLAPVGTPMANRWALTVGFYPDTGRVSHRGYHGAVGVENLGYDFQGYPVLLGYRDFRQRFQDWCAYSKCVWPDWLMQGRGNATPGAAFSFVPITDVRPVGISVLNKSRRARSRMFQVARDTQARVIGATALSSRIFAEMADLWFLPLPDYFPRQWANMVAQIMGLAISTAQAMKEMERGEQSDMCNDGEGWNTRFGVTGGMGKSVLERLDQERKDDEKWIAKLQPFKDVRGEEFYHKPEAKELWDFACKWHSYTSGFAHFDWGNPNQNDLKQPERIDDYTPNYPELDMKVENLPKPKKDPTHRVRAGLLPFGGQP